MWFNVVALLEDSGVRYYCNVASPPYISGNVLTYIDYDLDVIRMPGGDVHIVDQEEYERHKITYHYSGIVDSKVKTGLRELLKRIDKGRAPFHEDLVRSYYEEWEKWKGPGTEA
jgi:protein associated with RNAse G/E